MADAAGYRVADGVPIREPIELCMMCVLSKGTMYTMHDMQQPDRAEPDLNVDGKTP